MAYNADQANKMFVRLFVDEVYPACELSPCAGVLNKSDALNE